MRAGTPRQQRSMHHCMHVTLRQGRGFRWAESRRRASMPASTMGAGVSKSGSPAARETTSAPASRMDAARSDSAMVLEGRRDATKGFSVWSTPGAAPFAAPLLLRGIVAAAIAVHRMPARGSSVSAACNRFRATHAHGASVMRHVGGACAAVSVIGFAAQVQHRSRYGTRPAKSTSEGHSRGSTSRWVHRCYMVR